MTVKGVPIRPPASPGSVVLQLTLVADDASFETSAPPPPCSQSPLSHHARPLLLLLLLLILALPRRNGRRSTSQRRWSRGSIGQDGKIRDKSCDVWSAGSVQASYTGTGPGTQVDVLAPQTRIPSAIAPGQEVHVDDFLILPPAEPGSYELQLTLVDQDAWWTPRAPPPYACRSS